MPPSPLEYELYRRAQRQPDYAAVLSDIYNRVQPPAAMMSPSTMASAVVKAVRRPGVPTREVVSDLRFQQQRLVSGWREKRRFLRAEPDGGRLLGDDLPAEQIPVTV